MDERYEALRSVSDKSLHLIFVQGGFAALTRIRQLGPWQGLSGGEIMRLKVYYRLQRAKQNFVVVYQQVAAFSVQA